MILRELKGGQSVIKLCAELHLSETTFRRECTNRADWLQLYPEVARILPMLSQEKQLGIVTSLPARIFGPLLEHFDLARHFRAVIHPGNCRQLKPSPAPILRAVNELRVDASAAYYVGDLLSDARASRAAGVRFAWAAYGYSSIELEADVRIDRFSSVRNL